ncbi:MAG TPA: lamin tail domain-containing protein [Thermoanaerobaculia bacterium]
MNVRRAIPVFLLVLFAATTAFAVSPNIVISQVYGGAGCGTAGCSAYRNDYIELFNRGGAPVTLTNWSVQYAAQTGTSWQVTTVNATIPAGGYLLVGQAGNANGVSTLPAPVDVTGTISMSATSAKVALVNTNTALTGRCGNGATLTLPASVVDFVGYGTGADCNDAGATTGGAGNAPAPSTTNATFRAAGGCTDTDSNSADFAAAAAAPRNSATTPAPCAGPPVITLNINDVSQAETDAGTTTFTFAVTLSAPAGAGGVTFDIATADGTAQDDNPATEDNDYVANSLTGQSIPMGSTGPYNFNVTVNGDTATEANETFFVNVTNIVGANAGDAQGQGTIQNDDFSVVLIHDVQGNGAASPVTGATVSVRGIVTLLKSNGFFLQEEEGDYDADPNTSEGIFVFTSSAPTVAVGDDATVTGTVVEFNGLTEISPASSIIVNSTGSPLPTAIVLTPLDLPPAGNITQPQLEKYESMRVTAASLTTVAPNDSFFDVDTVLTGEPRPMREPGIPVSDPVPPDPTTGLPDCCIPIWDENPERLSVDTNGRAGSTGETLTSNVTLTNVTGPLDYSFSRYRLINEVNLTRTANMSAVPVRLPAANEFTIAGYNIENFNNNATQRQKAALTVRDVLRLPDIIGTVEIFDLADLQALATEIQTISGVAYSAHLIEQDGTSEDSDQDVGFLVKTSRVSVTSVTQERAAETYVNPLTSSPETLHDRPPLVLRAIVDPSGPSPQPVIVVVNHLRSFIDVELVAGEGVRVREKRKKQAESLGDLLNELQTDNPGTPVVSVGDYNAFQFNSGYDDSISVIRGVPTPDDQIVVDQSPDVVNPDFLNLLLNVPADQRYTFLFENTPQALDHVLANTAAQAINSDIAVARVNSDFPEAPAAAFASNAARPEANSDHDPVVAYFLLPASADVSVTKTDNVDPVNAGQNFFYTITVTNGGTEAADNVSWSDALPAGTTFVSLSQPGGWTCTTPAVGANGTVTCSIASLGVTSAAFNVTVAVNAGLASGTVLSNTATVTSTTTDPTPGNNSDTETTTVATSADLLLSKTDSPDPVNAGSNLSYTITLTNNGPSNSNATFTDTLPAGTTFVSLSTTGSWSCTTPAVGATGTVTCTNASFLVTVDFFTLVVQVDPSVAAGTVLSNTATLSSTTPDPNGANNSETATTTVATSADLLLSKTDSPDPVNAGSNLSYQITLTNAGPSNATSATFTDTLPAGTTFVSLSTTGPWTCTTPAVGATGTVTCTNPSYGGVDFFTLVVNVNPAVAAGTVLSNTATLSSATPDPNGANNSETATTTVAASADVQVTKTDAPDPVTAGTNLTYTITVSNPGPSDAASVTLADSVPANTTFVSLAQPGGWTCTTPAVGGTGAINCSIATLPAGGNGVFTLVVNTSAGLSNGAVLTNTATVATTTPESSTANNTATATTTVGTGSADLSISKTDSPDPVNAGSILSYTITVTNAGPSAATSASFSDTLPAGTTFASLASPAGWTCTTPPGDAAGTVTCSNPSFGVTSAVFTLGVRVDPALLAGNVISNTATVTSATTDPTPANNSATETTNVTASADLLLSKTDTPDPVFAGSNISYQLTLTNNGPSNAAAATFTDTLPAGTTFVSMSTTGPWTCTTPAVGATGTVTCNNTSFGVTVDFFTIVVQTDAGLASGTVLTNTATISSTTTDPNPANNSSTATTTIGVGSADVGIAKVDTPDPVNAGGNITYTITVSNAGPTNAASAAMNDTLPAGTTFVSLSAPAGWTCTTPAVGATGTVSCTNPSLGTGNAVFSLVARVAPGTTPGTVITNTATVTSTTADPNLGNESATTTTNVVAPANVSGTKTVTGTFVPSGSITYTITLTNNGASTQADNPGDEFVDVLPASLTLVSATATSGTAVATPATRTVTWNGSIAAGASVTITINATIRSDAAPGTTVTNQGTINYDADGNGTNESTRQTDSPSDPGAADATTFVVAPTSHANIPTLDEWALLALAALIAAVAAFVLKR